jgi:DNA-binding response OmpR family regulator
MIVDDNREFAQELKETLVLSGYEVVVYYDGKTALEHVEREAPDVVLLDLKMEGKSGFQVADEMKFGKSTKDIPIIAITGYFTEEQHRELMSICGIKACILKPFNPLDVIAKIETIVQLKEDGRLSESGSSMIR